MTQTLHLDIGGGIARLRIDRPARRNAMNQSMWQAFPGLVDEAMANPAVRLLIVESAHAGAFCAGADIAEFALSSADPDWRKANNTAIHATQSTLRHAPKPTLAAIDGDCIGGGCVIALACDMRIASPRARFGVTPAKLGLVYPFDDTKALVDLVGPGQARRLLYTAMLVDAAEALRIGLVEQVADDLNVAVAAHAAAILATSGHTQRATKKIVARILAGDTDAERSTAGQFDSAFEGSDFTEGVAAFLAKRPAEFR